MNLAWSNEKQSIFIKIIIHKKRISGTNFSFASIEEKLNTTTRKSVP
jgi:hypothetical protein